MKLIGAAEVLANFVESHGWYHPELKCTACSHEHTYKNIGLRICKYCKRVWSAYDSECPLGNALDTVVKESNKRTIAYEVAEQHRGALDMLTPFDTLHKEKD